MPNYTYARSQGRNRIGRRRYGRYVTKNYLKAVIGTPEPKFIDYPLASFLASSTLAASSTFLLNYIRLGTSDTGRIGNQITNKSLHVRLNMARPAALDAMVRVIIFWNMDADNTPNTNLLQDNTAGNAYISPLNKDFGKSFWVRYDRTYTLAAGQTQLVVDEIWRKLKCVTEYTGDPTPENPGAQPTITKNALYITFISNQVTSDNFPSCSMYARLNYMDT